MIESPGTLIGLSNVLTRAKYRPAPGLDLDTHPALLERVRTNAVRALEGRESYIHDAILLGRRVRLLSNSHHLADFWRDNFPTEAEWKRRTAEPISPKPFLTVHAMINVEAESEAAYASRARREVYAFNSSYYGGLRACALEAFGRLLGEGHHVLHAAAVEVNGRGVAILYPKELIHPTPSWGLMEMVGTRFLADGWIAVEPGGRIRALEKSVYLRTSMLESYPEYAARILPAKFENVPDADPRGDLVARLVANTESRAMVSAAALFGAARVTESFTAAAAFQLSPGAGEPIRTAPVDPFPCPGYEIRVGAVSGHPREVARLIARA